MMMTIIIIIGGNGDDTHNRHIHVCLLPCMHTLFKYIKQRNGIFSACILSMESIYIFSLIFVRPFLSENLFIVSPNIS
jgi:hypothetical protein